MVFKFYNNNQIVAPLKCGTRYLEKVFGEPSKEIASQDFKGRLIYPDLKTIVIRDPLEHLSSAIHTEVLGFLQDDNTKNIRPLIKQFTSVESKNCQNTHWDRYFYADIYWYWRRNHNYNNIDVIDLKNLSSYLKENIKEELPVYDSNNYNFNHYKYWCTKEDLMLFIKENYEWEWNNLMQQVKTTTIFYNYLINKEIVDIKLL